MSIERLKISVVIPAYNAAPYLPRCLDSLLGQTYRNLEILVVDDGSLDDTGKILDAYAQRDSRILAIHQENGGVTRARLLGVSRATGDYIGFVDGDDLVEPDMYRRLLENAISYDADISHCGYRMVFPNRMDFYYNTGRLVVQDTQAGLKDLLEGTMVEPGLVNKLFRRELLGTLLQRGSMDPEVRINEDLLMNYYLFKLASRSVYADFCPYHYMVRKNSAATSVHIRQLRDPLYVLDRIAADTGKQDALTPILDRRILAQLIRISTYPAKDREIRDFRREIRRRLRTRLPEIWKGSQYSGKQRLLALWAGLWPASYGWMHSLYARITGSSRRYEVD